MVTFRPEIRYSEALVRARQQERIMDEIMQQPDIQTRWQEPDITAEAIFKLDLTVSASRILAK